MPEFLSVGDVATRLDVKPSQITALFYERRLRDALCPIVGGRRIIPREMVDVIAMELRRKGIATTSPESSTKGVENDC